MPISESLKLANQDKNPQLVPPSMTAEVNRKVPIIRRRAQWCIIEERFPVGK